MKKGIVFLLVLLTGVFAFEIANAVVGAWYDDAIELIFGTSSDFKISYDEATDDRLEITDGTNLGFWIKDQGTTFDAGITGNLTIGSGMDIRPSANSTTALNIAQADGTDFVAFDTTNKRIGIGVTPSHRFHIENSNEGGNETLFLKNSDNTNGSSNARVYMQVGGASGGDPYYLAAISGSTVWSWGIDNSDSDKWMLSNTTGLGSPKLTVTTGGSVGINTTAPAYPLDVFGDVRFYDIYSTGGDIYGTTDGVLNVHADTNFVIDLDDDNDSTSKVSIKDGANTEVTSIDETGLITTTGAISIGAGQTYKINGTQITTITGLSDYANIGMLNEAETIASNWVNTANPWEDNEVSDTLTASIFVGSGSTTNAVDLGTAEVAGTLAAASVGTGLTDAQVSNTLTSSFFIGSGSTTNAVDLATAEVAGTLADGNVADGLTLNTAKVTDDTTLSWGTDSDIRFVYDEATDDRLEITDGTNLGFWIKDQGTTFDAGITGNFNVAGKLATQTITTFTADDTSPTVDAGNIFKVPATWTAANDITAFDNGVTGQIILVIGGDSDCAVVDGANLLLNGNWTANANDTLSLVFDGSNWYELSRSDN